ncbi:rhodanese-like domain-containing protein [Tropicibacter alexandrii]|uniref:rhodanese-like domain-containing protein n=1 Tax=Tropicibacter alexandrii TaxID=2267683 RepID=UPI000EF44D5B|nr:rhodanese-like domain-containing protein [Tropicibacter alexandrii]
MIKGLIPALCCMATVLAHPAGAQSGRISETRDSFQFSLNGVPVTIERKGRSCPSDCIQPMQAVRGVATIGELELLDFLEIFVASGKGLLIDARLPQGFASGTVPGAVNVPEATLRPDNPYRDDLLSALGVRGGDFSGAFDLVLFGGGADDAQAVSALRSLSDSGYPADKLKYYRGGVQAWTALGLSLASGQ